MSGQPKRRWYAPRLKGWRPELMSRRQALTIALFSVIAATGSLVGAAFGDEEGPVRATINWLLVAGWSVAAYLHLAHAAFHTTRGTEGPDGGA